MKFNETSTGLSNTVVLVWTRNDKVCVVLAQAIPLTHCQTTEQTLLISPNRIANTQLYTSNEVPGLPRQKRSYTKPSSFWNVLPDMFWGTVGRTHNYGPKRAPKPPLAQVCCAVKYSASFIDLRHFVADNAQTISYKRIFGTDRSPRPPLQAR